MGIKCPKVYGDPAILLPLFYNKEIQVKKEYVLIPHYSKLTLPEYAGRDDVVGSFVKDWRVFVDKILEAKLVISSSLHGIIIAEAYGIPAVMWHDTPHEDIFKYRDYYESTGRSSFPIVSSIEEAKNTQIIAPDKGIIEKLQKDLLDSFPLDLWD